MPAVPQRRHADLRHQRGDRRQHGTGWGDIRCIEAGPYGTLYVNSTTGAYTFVPDSGAINALTAPTTESFIITVSDGTLSASQTFTIAINGTNDAAIISGTTAGSVIEAGGVANAAPGTPTATGTLTDTDVDNAAQHLHGG